MIGSKYWEKNSGVVLLYERHGWTAIDFVFFSLWLQTYRRIHPDEDRDDIELREEYQSIRLRA